MANAWYDTPIPADLEEEPLTPEQVDTELDWPADSDDPERWRINDDGAAEWAMRKLAGAERSVYEAGVQAAAWRERITMWEERVTHPFGRQTRWLTGLLVDYAARRRARTKQATLVLPSGEVISRAAKTPKVEVTDRDAFCAWALAQGLDSVVRTTTTHAPAMAELREQATIKTVPVDGDEGRTRYAVYLNGIEVPDVAVVPPATTFTVKSS